MAGLTVRQQYYMQILGHEVRVHLIGIETRNQAGSIHASDGRDVIIGKVSLADPETGDLLIAASDSDIFIPGHAISWIVPK